MFSISKSSYLRERALQPTRRKAGLTRNGSEALGDKEIERDPQEGTENDPQGGEGESETAWTTSARATAVVFTSKVHPP